MTDPQDDLRELDAQIRASGLPGMEAVAGAVAELAAGDADEATRLQAVVRAYVAMVDSARALISREQGKVEGMLSATPEGDPSRAALGDIAFSFREQQEGLRALRGFLEGGDRRLLNEAREKLARGAATARQAARAQGGG